VARPTVEFDEGEAMMRLTSVGVLVGILALACGGSNEVTFTEVTDAMADAVDEGGAPAASSGKCKGLDAYAKFVDEYIEVLEAGSLDQAMEWMVKAEEAAAGLEDLDPSNDCFREYMAISKKMSDAALRMSGASAADMQEMDEAFEEAGEAMDEAMEAVGCMEKCEGIDDPGAMMSCMSGCM
jgi:hypothetical protein